MRMMRLHRAHPRLSAGNMQAEQQHKHELSPRPSRAASREPQERSQGGGLCRGAQIKHWKHGSAASCEPVRRASRACASTTIQDLARAPHQLTRCRCQRWRPPKEQASLKAASPLSFALSASGPRRGASLGVPSPSASSPQPRSCGFVYLPRFGGRRPLCG